MSAKEVLQERMHINMEILDADLKTIAWQWESALEQLNYAGNPGNRRQAMFLLTIITIAYLRGRGCKMGNYKGFQTHIGTMVLFSACVWMKAEEEGEIMFPLLHQCLADGDYDVIGEAEKILRGNR